MDSRQALKETMFRFDLRGSDLAELAGVKPTQISSFRTGLRGLYVDSLDKIINAMPPEARAYYYELQWKVAINPTMPKLRFNVPVSDSEISKGSKAAREVLAS